VKVILIQGNRISRGEGLGEISLVPSAHQPLGLDPDLGRGLPQQPVEGDVARHGDVLGGMAATDATVVLAKRHGQLPVQPG